MKKKLQISFNPIVVAMLILGTIYIVGSCTTTQIPAAKPLCVVSASDFASWFVSGAVTLDGVVEPADGLTFQNVPNCDFYEWSEQMFLWLTSPTPPSYGGGGGRIFASPAFYTVSPPDPSTGDRTFIPNTPGGLGIFTVRAAQVGLHRLPIVIEKTSLRAIEIVPPVFAPNGNQIILNRSGERTEIGKSEISKNGKPVFFDNAGREIFSPRPVIPPELIEAPVAQKFMFGKIPILIGALGNVIETEQGQAGGGEVLRAINGSLVYYTTTVNDVFAYYLTGAKHADPMIVNPLEFPATAAELTGVINYASSHGKTLVDPQAMAVEVKASWVEAAGLTNPNEYITLTATIPTYTVDATNDTWTQTGQKTTLMALVGFHVVGTVAAPIPGQEHHEFIWATFEHESNTPNVAYKFIDPSNATVTQPTDIANGNWLFCANNAPGPFNEAHMFFNSSGNKIETLFEPPLFTVPFHVTPSNTQRLFPWGANPNSATSNTEIISINNSIRGMLASADVRKRYIFRGATWTPNGVDPSVAQVGTKILSNSTMETYQTSSNCFTCHGPTTKAVDISHIFGALQPLF